MENRGEEGKEAYYRLGGGTGLARPVATAEERLASEKVGRRRPFRTPFY